MGLGPARGEPGRTCCLLMALRLLSSPLRRVRAPSVRWLRWLSELVLLQSCGLYPPRLQTFYAVNDELDGPDLARLSRRVRQTLDIETSLRSGAPVGALAASPVRTAVPCAQLGG